MKTEMYCEYEKDFESFEAFPKVVDEYMNYYNNIRVQAKTKWMSL